MKSTKAKTLGVCIATLFFLLMAIGSSSSGSSNSASNNTTTTAQTQQNVQTTSARGVSDDTSASSESDTVKLYFDIDFIANLVFSTYDIEVYVDDTKIGTIPHGEHYTYLMDIKKGKHTVKFYKDSDNDVSSSKNIDINNDSTFKCSLHSYASDISIDDYKLEEDVTGASLTMIDVVGITLDVAKKNLKEVGFVNIKAESDNGKMIMLDSNWTVTSQSVEVGTVADKNIEIVLTCHKGDETATTAETTTVTITSDTTKPASSNEDFHIYDISWYNLETQNKLNTAMSVYLDEMLDKLSKQANQNNMNLEEITDWSRFKVLEGSPYPNFSARVIVLTDTPSKAQLLVENSKAYELGEYFNSLGKYGFNNGAKSSNWVYIPNPTSGTSFSFIIYKENGKEYGFLQIDKYDMSESTSETPAETTAATTTTATTSAAETTKSAGSVSYSTNDKNTVKDGDKGVYSYKNSGDMYYIIDFDAGYVYSFSKLDSTCDRVKIISGNLNDCVFVKYNDGGSSWRQGFYFKWKRQPDHLIVLEDNGAEYDFYTTNLNDALKMKNERTIKDY